MIKSLLIGASALALTAGAAAAQSAGSANPATTGTFSNPNPVSVQQITAGPVDTTEQTNFAAGIRDVTDATPLGQANPVINSDPTTAKTAISAAAAPDTATVLSNVATGSTGFAGLNASGNKAAVQQNHVATTPFQSWSGGNDNNTAVVDQAGGKNGWAAALQNGDYNKASIDQGDGSDGSAVSVNQAFVQQVSGSPASQAAGQTAEVYQRNLTQAATANRAAILQGGMGGSLAVGEVAAVPNSTGTDNFARIQQGSGIAAAQGNSATIAQGVAAGSGTNNYSLVEQGGDNNKALNQQQSHAWSRALQKNGNNEAYVVQADGGSSADELVSDIDQNDGNNYAAVYQSTAAGGAISDIDQTGGSNSAFVHQIGDNARSVIEQRDGTGNLAFVDQRSADVESTIRQSDNDNEADVLQTAQGVDSVIFQNSGLSGLTGVGGNYAFVSQSVANSMATVSQNGAGNFVSIVQ